jgi:DeoR family fructose operon transcriptional repressor
MGDNEELTKNDNAVELTPAESNPLPAERHLRIRELLRERVTIRVSELSEKLSVSEMTIRRDLETLERQGFLERTHGGAVYRQERMTQESSYETRLKESVDVKDLIGRRAAALIEPNDSIFLHSGTTTLYILRYLDPEMPVRIYTNNIGAIDEVRGKRAELVMLGGEFRRESNSLEGPLTMEMIQKLHPSKAFLTVDGISLKDGITTPYFAEAALERAFIQQTRGQVVVMATHSAFGRVAEVSVAPIEQVDILIVDQNLPTDYLRDLEGMGVKVLVA